MTERETLEACAKAMDMNLTDYRWYDSPVAAYYQTINGRPSPFRWNPLTSPGDCAEMEASLGIDVEWHPYAVNCRQTDGENMPWASALYSKHPTRQAARMAASCAVAAQIAGTT